MCPSLRERMLPDSEYSCNKNTNIEYIQYMEYSYNKNTNLEYIEYIEYSCNKNTNIEYIIAIRMAQVPFFSFLSWHSVSKDNICKRWYFGNDES